MSLFGNEAGGSGGAAGARKGGLALTLHFDGGSRGNPGPAGIGVVLLDEKKRAVYELGEFLGYRTNNFAEYTALVRGLAAAKALGAGKVTVKADSELVVRQINGQYKVKSPELLPLYQQAKALMREIGDVTVSHVYREGNARADELANMAMDGEAKVEPLGAPGVGPGAGGAVKRGSGGMEAGEVLDEQLQEGVARMIGMLEAARRADEKLTVEQLQVFLVIARKGGGTAAEVGDEIKRSAGAVMRMVMDVLAGRLEWVTVDNRESDPPVDRLFVTEKGKRFLREGLG